MRKFNACVRRYATEYRIFTATSRCSMRSVFLRCNNLNKLTLFPNCSAVVCFFFTNYLTLRYLSIIRHISNLSVH
jgi:hypothetical protein